MEVIERGTPIKYSERVAVPDNYIVQKGEAVEISQVNFWKRMSDQEFVTEINNLTANLPPYKNKITTPNGVAIVYWYRMEWEAYGHYPVDDVIESDYQISITMHLVGDPMGIDDVIAFLTVVAPLIIAILSFWIKWKLVEAILPILPEPWFWGVLLVLALAYMGLKIPKPKKEEKGG